VGDSRVVDPLGEMLATGAVGETVLLADVDPAHVAATRRRFGFLDDRR
jgi:predicted amidohydrolase